MTVATSTGILSSVFFIVLVCQFLFRRRTLNDLRGPPSPSFLLGHEHRLRHQEEVGELDFMWIREYGNAWLTKGCCGEDILMICDPLALQYVLQTSGYHFPKRADAIQVVKLITGRGIVTVLGEAHERHRKIMNPAFSGAQLRSFLPLFRSSAARLSQKWKDQLQVIPTADGLVLNVSRWLARTTLDVIGEAAFDYHFGALDDSKNELLTVFDNLFADSLLYPPKADILFKSLWRYIPESILQFVEFIPTREYRRFRHFLKLTKKTAKSLIEQKSSSAQGEKSGRDVMTILLRSNLSEDSKHRLDEDEVLSQMSTLMLAGHDTTASSLSWLLFELSHHPEDQQKIRDEIDAARVNILARGDDDFTISDLEGMTFMNACLKEGMRMHPIVPNLVRRAGRDDVIPLSHPIETKSGQMISEIPIVKGQSLVISICGYNRLPSVWGEDADKWNPSRFLEIDQQKRVQVGILANLMTFSAGIRGCIGWRFALIEMQAILTELIENFEFISPSGVEIQRLPAGLMVPMVKGKMSEGTQMPLRVSLRCRE